MVFSVKIVFLFSTIALLSVMSANSASTDPEAEVKCDACMLIAQKFSDGFLSAEEKLKTVRLNDKQITEAAEGVCDELWRGYETVNEGGVKRLAGPLTGRDSPVAEDDENVWSHRLQDFCDEMMAELPAENTLYNAWSADHDSLEDLLCKGEASFSACTSANFGNWPGDDDYDYDEEDFDYVHDEF